MFLHPVLMIAGGILISSPIIIHLINRMRFKRVRWAAMEFLLKSQKKNRRKLLIEQLILLLLRILLVLLAGFLVARFVGAATRGGSGTLHVVVVDDSLSMGDRWAEDTDKRTCFDVARLQLKDLVRNALKANSVQEMQVVLLSDPDNPIFNDRLSNLSEQKIEDELSSRKPTYLHLSPLDGLQKGSEILLRDGSGRAKVLHFVSDFRESDWGTGPQVKELTEKLTDLTEKGINVSLIDTAHPYRGATEASVTAHENLAVVDLRAETRVCAEFQDIEFTAVIDNYSGREQRPQLHVQVNGKEDFRGTKQIPGIPAGGRYEQKFTLSFQKARSVPEFVHVRALLDATESGLAADHVRDVVVEVRKKVAALVVDGNVDAAWSAAAGLKPHSDGLLLREALTSVIAYTVDFKSVDDLMNLLQENKLDLSPYPTVYLLDVKDLPDPLVKKLKAYVQGGGGIAFFMGPRVDATFYDETLHRGNDGLFPLLINRQPTKALTEEEKKAMRQDDKSDKLLFPDPTHPVVKVGLAAYGPVTQPVVISQYFEPMNRTEWVPSAQKETEAIIQMPNRKDIRAYQQRALDLIARTLDRAKELPEADREKYLPLVEKHRQKLRDALEKTFLFDLEQALAELLRGSPEDFEAKAPAMTELWKKPAMRDLGAQIETFRKTVLYGDPLLVGRPYGKGKVAAFLTSAGTGSKWNDWADGGHLGMFLYPPFVLNLQRWLTSPGEDINRTLTVEDVSLKYTFDAALYQPRVKITFTPQQEPAAAAKRGDKPADPAAEGPKPEETQVAMSQADGLFTFAFTQDGFGARAEKKEGEKEDTRTRRLGDARRPGVYTFEFKPLKPGAEAETQAVAFNVDAAAESNLRRATREQLLTVPESKGLRAGKVRLFARGDSFETFKNKEPDASEAPWLYLFFLLILVAEQAMAVHLSFHARAGEHGAGPLPVAAPAPVAAA